MIYRCLKITTGVLNSIIFWYIFSANDDVLHFYTFMRVCLEVKIFYILLSRRKHAQSLEKKWAFKVFILIMTNFVFYNICTKLPCRDTKQMIFLIHEYTTFRESAGKNYINSATKYQCNISLMYASSLLWIHFPNWILSQ